MTEDCDDIRHKKKNMIDKVLIYKGPLATRVASQTGRDKRALLGILSSSSSREDIGEEKEAKYRLWLVSNLLLLDSTLEEYELNKIAMEVLMAELAETIEGTCQGGNKKELQQLVCDNADLQTQVCHLSEKELRLESERSD